MGRHEPEAPHNPKVAGSNLAPATKERADQGRRASAGPSVSEAIFYRIFYRTVWNDPPPGGIRRAPWSVTSRALLRRSVPSSHLIAATNQLMALLGRHWPGAATIFASLDSEIALAFLDDYPTPAAATRLGEARMKMFCRRHRHLWTAQSSRARRTAARRPGADAGAVAGDPPRAGAGPGASAALGASHDR